MKLKVNNSLPSFIPKWNKNKSILDNSPDSSVGGGGSDGFHVWTDVAWLELSTEWGNKIIEMMPVYVVSYIGTFLFIALVVPLYELFDI